MRDGSSLIFDCGKDTLTKTNGVETRARSRVCVWDGVLDMLLAIINIFLQFDSE